MVVSEGRPMTGTMATVMKHIGVGKAKGEMMEFHIQLHFGQGKTTFKKKGGKKRRNKRMCFSFLPIASSKFSPLNLSTIREHYTIVIIIYQNRTVNVLQRHIKNKS